MGFRTQRGAGQTGALTPPSSSFWTARLIERKRAEEALHEEFAELNERLDQQSAQLERLSEALRRETVARERAEAAVPQGVEAPPATIPGGAAGVPERPEEEQEARRVEYAELTDRVERHAAELRMLSEALTGERAARERSEQALREVQADLNRRVRMQLQAASVTARGGLENETGAGWVSGPEYAEVNGRVEGLRAEIRALGERLEREAADRVEAGTALEDAHGDLKRVMSRFGTLGEDWATRLVEVKQAQDAVEGACAQLSDELGEQRGALDALSGLVAREVGELREAETSFRRGQVELQKQVTWEIPARLRAIESGLEQERADRAGVEAALRELQGEVEGRFAETATRVLELEQAVSREGEKHREVGAAVQELQGELAQRFDGAAMQVLALEQAVNREIEARSEVGGAVQELRGELAERLTEAASRVLELEQAMSREIEARREVGAAVQELRGELAGRLSDAATRVLELGQAVNREIGEREEVGAAVRELRGELGRRLDEAASRVLALEQAVQREIEGRKRLVGTVHKIEAELGRRMGGHEGSAASGCPAPSPEADKPGALETALGELATAQAELERRAGEHAAALDAITGALADHGAERESIQVTLRRVERAQRELAHRMGTIDSQVAVPRPTESAHASVSTEVALRQAGEAAASANGGGGALRATLRHGIGLPVNGVIAMTELALDTELTTAQRGYLERAKSLAEAVVNVISNRKSEGRRETPEPVAFRLRENLRDTLKPLLLRAHQKGLELSCHIAPRVPNAVVGDATRLSHVLVNLVGNAVKFTTEGEVAVCVDAATQTQAEMVLLVTITDSGSGIAAADQAPIFDALRGGVGWEPAPDVAVGLGIAVAAQLVRSMDGRIWFESDEHQGTSFRFTVRLGLQAESDSRPAWALRREPVQPAARRIGPPVGERKERLILLGGPECEDRATIKRVLEAHGHVAITVEDGRGVIAALENDFFDLVLMDLHMPAMSGLEAAATIRTRENASGAHTPIVTLAAGVSDGDRQRCRAVGVEACVSRPVDVVGLLGTIDSLLNPGGRQDDSSARERLGE